MSDDVIELNGKRYDALTGAFLGKSAAKPVPAPSAGRVIDGFIRPSHPAAKSKTAAVASKKPVHHTPAVHHVAAAKHHATPTHHYAAPKHLKAHRPEHAQTLMRRAVRRPEAKLKPAIKLQTPTEMMAKPQSALMRQKHSVTQVDPMRHERAERTNRHQAIRRFHQPHAGMSTTAALHTGTTAHVPIIAVKPAPQGHISRPSMHAVRSSQDHSDIFEAAISHANSHAQAYKKHPHRRHRRLINTLAIVGAFLVIGSFVTYLSLPSIELRVASVQAGFRISRPGYTPTGYALENGVKRSGGTVSMSFRSGDSRYVITQQASNWNSQTLLDNTLALNGEHETLQKNGQTIYIYSNGRGAAWVNGGIRYDVSGNAQLSKDEIASIATSM